MFTWRDNSQNRWCGIGSPSHLYAYNGGTLYDITPLGLTAGRDDSFAGVGFGFGPYGSGSYGVPPNVTTIIDATTWSFDNWGQYLVACSSSDGKLYQWNVDRTLKAVAVVNAPVSCTGLIVTAERYMVALGASGDPRAVAWSDQEDNTTWTPSALNTAGDLRIQTNGRIRTARRVRSQVVIWTDTDLHAMNYLGPPLVYGIERVGGFCGIASQNAVSIIEAGAVWMSASSFFIYDGALRDIPCDVADYVFGDFNQVQRAKVYAGHNSQFAEVWWFYCSAASDEVDRYVSWNYRENHWSIGSLPRTSWASSGVFDFPMAISTSGYIYEQENGWTDDGAPLAATRFLRSGPVEIADGDRIMSVSQIVPDERTSGQVNLTLQARFTPEGTQYTAGPFTVAPYTDARFSGRQVSLEIDGVSDADWRVGTIRLDAISGGRR